MYALRAHAAHFRLTRRAHGAVAQLRTRVLTRVENFATRSTATRDVGVKHGIIDDHVKEMLKDGFNDHQVREAMKKNGMKTIADKLKEMLISGHTSYEEAIRVGLMDG